MCVRLLPVLLLLLVRPLISKYQIAFRGLLGSFFPRRGEAIFSKFEMTQLDRLLDEAFGTQILSIQLSLTTHVTIDLVSQI